MVVAHEVEQVRLLVLAQQSGVVVPDLAVRQLLAEERFALNGAEQQCEHAKRQYAGYPPPAQPARQRLSDYAGRQHGEQRQHVQVDAVGAVEQDDCHEP